LNKQQLKSRKRQLQKTIEKKTFKKNKRNDKMSKQKYLLLDFSVSCSKMLKQQQKQQQDKCK